VCWIWHFSARWSILTAFLPSSGLGQPPRVCVRSGALFCPQIGRSYIDVKGWAIVLFLNIILKSVDDEQDAVYVTRIYGGEECATQVLNAEKVKSLAKT